MRVEPAKIINGPNSPNARAQARVAAVRIPRPASGRTTVQNAWLRLQPNVIATCSPRGEISSNVARKVRTANALATANCARMTAGICRAIGYASSRTLKGVWRNSIRRLRPTTSGGRKMGISNSESTNALPRNSKRDIKYPIGIATHNAATVVTQDEVKLRKVEYRISGVNSTPKTLSILPKE